MQPRIYQLKPKLLPRIQDSRDSMSSEHPWASAVREQENKEQKNIIDKAAQLNIGQESQSSDERGWSAGRGLDSFAFPQTANNSATRTTSSAATNSTSGFGGGRQMATSVFGGGGFGESGGFGSSFGSNFGSTAGFGAGYGRGKPTRAGHQSFTGQSAADQRDGARATSTKQTTSYSGTTLKNGEDDESEPVEKTDISLLNKLVHKKLEDLENGELIVQNPSDPSSPLYSVKSFEDLRLNPNLIRGVFEMGFQQPSKIQETALPILLCEPPQNLIAQSQSGTGKTAAFVLTMLSRVKAEEKWPQCLCLAPTYELALQIGEVVEIMGKYLPDIKLRYAVRGQMMGRQERLEEQIVIGTPGKTLDWLVKYRVIDASKLKVFVLDEADVMISVQGHQDQSVRIHNEIERRTNKQCQCLLFSATYEDQVVEFAEKIVKNPMVITLRREEQTLDNIKQFYVECQTRDEKFKAICNLYSGLTIGSAIIFCRTRSTAAWLTEQMQQRRHAVKLLSGELSIEDRAMVIQEFKNGVHKVLITTNVCSRGIDVSQVTIVLNYDPPVTTEGQPDFETYLHRIGRTGRFGKAGMAVNFCDGPRAIEIIKEIEQHFQKSIELLDTSNIEELEALESAD